MAELNVAQFQSRLEKLHAHFVKNRSQMYSDASCLLINRGPHSSEEFVLTSPRSVVLHTWLFGYELPDTILILNMSGDVWVGGFKRKIQFLQPAANGSSKNKLHLLTFNKQADDKINIDNYDAMAEAAGFDGDNVTVATLLKERPVNLQGGGLLQPWEERVDEVVKQSRVQLVDANGALSLCMAEKDEFELDLLKKSSVFSNKVMKHGFVRKLEEIIDSETPMTHSDFSQYINSILEDPGVIQLKVPPEDVSSCYLPTIQSGGEYDLRLNAQSSTKNLQHDIITINFGAKYRLYCSHMGRTFLVDPPKQVSETYEILLGMQEACLRAMRPGQLLKAVYKAAVTYLTAQNRSDLIEKLPKNLGFVIGLDLKDNILVLSNKNNAPFRQGMVFSLFVGFQGVELDEKARASTSEKSAIKNLSDYSLLISDMVGITDGSPDVMTKMGKNLTDISYTINEDDGDESEENDEEDDEDEDKPKAPKGDAALARKLAKEHANGTTSNGQRSSARLAKDSSTAHDAQEGVAERERRQMALMTRRNEERLRELARDNARNRNKNDNDALADELEAYKSTREYPDNVQPNQVKVDMANQCVLLPICGNPVPFHISTIKNVVLPDPDNATLLRINFYTAGMAVGKDAPANMAKLVQRYAPYASFIREMTFRSLDGHNLVQAFRQISELRKRARAKELSDLEEANLVEQEKLIRTKNERVPRLSDLTMRPFFAGRKTQGNLEAHTNGLRFISTRSEVVDIMYNNVKYAIYQPCESEIMVLIHFHLKNPIMVGKRKHSDIQFFTEVVDASTAVDGSRRSMYDPDELDDEQRERQLRKRLNLAFKDFCNKVLAVAKKNNYNLEFDLPYRDLGFHGNPHREMVHIMPTLNCLVNLTETPFFVVDLESVDHVHFERVTYMSKAFDIVLINKDFSKQPWRIDMIPNEDKDSIQEWLTDMEITYTEGPMNLNWKQIMLTVKDDDRFYMNTEEDEVTEKEAGWEFLRLYGREDEEEEDDDEEDSAFSDAKAGEAESEEEEEEESAFDSEEEEGSDFDGDEELEEEGMDWDDMEERAAADDRRRGQEREGSDEEVATSGRRGSVKASGGGRKAAGGGAGRASRKSGGGGEKKSSGGGARRGGNGEKRAGGSGFARGNQKKQRF